MALTSHERIMRIFQNKEIDRPALKLWGLRQQYDNPEWILHPAYNRIIELGNRYTDIFEDEGSAFNILCGRLYDEYASVETVATDDPLWRDAVRTIHTPKGDLRSVHRYSTVKAPGYHMEYLIKSESDLEKLLSLPYEPFPMDVTPYLNETARLGERGLVMFSLPHAAYGLQDLCGSENLGYFRADCPDLLNEAIDTFVGRVLEHTKAVLAAGITPVFSWVGPELFLPPLMSPRDFHNYVTVPDKKICDLIHDAGGYVWVHSHNKVANFIEEFIDMGVDVLNPLEPPKNGDVNMKDVVKRFGRRIGLEGNIEIQDLLLASKEQLRELMRECVTEGAKSGRFILCPSAGFMEYPFPTEHYIDNLEEYIRYGYELVTALA